MNSPSVSSPTRPGTCLRCAKRTREGALRGLWLRLWAPGCFPRGSRVGLTQEEGWVVLSALRYAVRSGLLHHLSPPEVRTLGMVKARATRSFS